MPAAMACTYQKPSSEDERFIALEIGAKAGDFARRENAKRRRIFH